MSYGDSADFCQGTGVRAVQSRIFLSVSVRDSKIEANFYIHANYGEKPVRYLPGRY